MRLGGFGSPRPVTANPIRGWRIVQRAMSPRWRGVLSPGDTPPCAPLLPRLSSLPEFELSFDGEKDIGPMTGTKWNV